MKTENNNPRRDFVKKSILTAAALTTSPSLIFGKNENMVPISQVSAQVLSGEDNLPRVAFICAAYFPLSHADIMATKFLTSIPTDDGMVKPSIKIVSMYIAQLGPNDIGARIAAMNGVPLYPTIADALTLGGDKLAVDGVIYVGEHGDYQYNSVGEKMYPRLNFLEQIFRVYDGSGKVVPTFTDKALAYSCLDSTWIYNRAKELNVPMMAGSSTPYWWRDPNLVHPIGTKITEAVAIGYASLDGYGIHVVEMLQCMVERRVGGETGVSSVEGIKGNDVWAAIDSGKISQELVDAACDKIKGKATGSMRDLVKMPLAVIIRYKDGTRGACLMLDEYVKTGWAYAAIADGATVACEFINPPTNAVYPTFSYLNLNIERLILTGKQQFPIERNLLTSCVIDIAIRSTVEGKIKKTPFLDIAYNVNGYEPAIRPISARPTDRSLGPWPPKGYEFIIPERLRKKQ